MVFQLEARSSSRSEQRLPTRLEKVVGLCQSSVEPDRKSLVNSGKASSRSGIGSTSMAITTMVPQATQPAGLGTVQDTSTSRSDMGGSGGVPPRNQVTTSRVAYLRQHYSDQKLSREASELLLSSWRQSHCSHMTHCVKNGSAGAWNGIVILFQNL